MRRHISTLIRRRAVLVNFAVQHGDLARGIAHDDGIMGRGDNGHTLLLIQITQQSKQFFRRLRVEVCRRLVGQ